MDADDRKKLVEQILFAAQKVKSNQREELGMDNDEVMHRVVADLSPALWREDGLDIVTVCVRTLEQPEVEVSALYNVLYLAHKEPTIEYLFILDGRTLPEPRDVLS